MSYFENLVSAEAIFFFDIKRFITQPAGIDLLIAHGDFVIIMNYILTALNLKKNCAPY